MHIPASPLQCALNHARASHATADAHYATLLHQQDQATAADPSLLARIRRAAEDRRMVASRIEALSVEAHDALTCGARSAYVLATQLARLDAELVVTVVTTIGSARDREHECDDAPTFLNVLRDAGMPETTSDKTTATSPAVTFAPLLDFQRYLQRYFTAMLLANPTSTTVHFALSLAHHLLHDFRDFLALSALSAAYSSYPVRRVLNACVKDLSQRDREAVEALIALFLPANNFDAYWEEYREQLTVVKSVREWQKAKEERGYSGKAGASTVNHDTAMFIRATPEAETKKIQPVYAIPWLTPAIDRVQVLRDQYHYGNTAVAFEHALSAPGKKAFAELLTTLDATLFVDSSATIPIDQHHSTVAEVTADKVAATRYCVQLMDIPVDRGVWHFLLTRACLTRKQLAEWSWDIMPKREAEAVPEEWLEDDGDSSDGDDDEPVLVDAPESEKSQHVVGETDHRSDSPEDLIVAAGDLSDIYDEVLGNDRT